MKTLLYSFILLILLFSCEQLSNQENIDNALPEVSSYQFLEFKKESNFKTIAIDTLQNFGAVIKNMERLSCEGKYFGLSFTENDTIFNLTGYSGCPDVTSISCYFNVNRIYIKNDSLQGYFGAIDNMISIQHLGEELEQISNNELSFRWDRNVLKPAMIHLFIDDKFGIEKTKTVLKEITREFNKINSVHGAENYFPYFIHFESYSWLDIPAPPPPPALPEIIPVVEID